MSLVEGVHHLTFLTEDIDGLSAFYERAFDARKTLDMTVEGVRHVFLEVGPTTVLHPLQFLEGRPRRRRRGRCSNAAASTTLPCGRLQLRCFASSGAVSNRREQRTKTCAT
jgi:catechol 2,3-dioxygenase-like lactoylglutathione lyase family enzyme